MPLYLTNNEERALHKFLTLAEQDPERTVQNILDQILETDRRGLQRVHTMLAAKLRKARHLRP